MLLQSQADEIQILPALPKAWNTGSVQGLMARGDFEIADMQWKNGRLSKLVVKSLAGGECRLRTGNALKTMAAGVKKSTAGSDYQYRFNTQRGKTYTFTN
ncbi:glycoside hydrolase family 95-like protein [Mucilaginibacter panaciglaebae]